MAHEILKEADRHLKNVVPEAGNRLKKLVILLELNDEADWLSLLPVCLRYSSALHQTRARPHTRARAMTNDPSPRYSSLRRNTSTAVSAPAPAVFENSKADRLFADTVGVVYR